jgi:hypothetical protein
LNFQSPQCRTINPLSYSVLAWRKSFVGEVEEEEEEEI